MNKTLKNIKNSLLIFINFIANFFKEDKPEDIDKVIELGIAIVNSIYLLRTGLDKGLETNATLVISLYFLALTGMVGNNIAKGKIYGNNNKFVKKDK